MKYIKTYEIHNYTTKYKVDDYILLAECDDNSVESDAKILKVHKTGDRNSYDINVFGNDGEFITTFVFEDEIERLLTPKEIKDFKMKITAKKYNI